jgi:beta-glucosidase
MLVTTPGATVIKSADKFDGILANFLAGERFMEATFDVLEGKVNPSGKLPFTMPNKANEQNMTKIQFPGINGTSQYTEKLEVGYRWYDAHNVVPAFPFGHGLSYTQFTYDKNSMKFEKEPNRSVRIKVTNTGKVKGKEVVQMYIGFPSEAGEPPKLLKGFKKIELNPGQSQNVMFKLPDRDISIWDDQ